MWPFADNNVPLTIPEQVSFTYRGCVCFLHRNADLTVMRGYVSVPKTSRFYGVSYHNEICDDLPVEQSITDSFFAPDGQFYLGFDCTDTFKPRIGHCPMPIRSRWWYHDDRDSRNQYTEANIAFAKKELCRVVDQLVDNSPVVKFSLAGIMIE